jgi:predicted acylesterase/phospholipase RssA
MTHRIPPLLVFAVALGVGASGCSILRTKGALESLGGKSDPPDPKYQVSLKTRIARLAKAHLADSYFDTERVSGWMVGLGGSQAPVERLTRCIVNAATDAGAEGNCYSDFMNETANTVAPPPRQFDVLKTRTNPEVTLELDSERFIANARALGASLAAMERMIGRGPLPPETLRAGVAEGANRAAAYVKKRTWRRSVQRPTTAVVLSGGAANGAFSAGLVWRLLDVLQTCHAAQTGGCPDARIDLVAGTSTGALIGLMIDMAATPGYGTPARNLLLDAYTCSTNTRLYCVQDDWIWKLAGDVKGMARFDGVRKIIRDSVPQSVGTNDTERVSVSVDFESGDVFAQSDQDPEDSGDWDHEVNGILASIVEPVLAEPVYEISHDGKPLLGTFLDGGVRSGLPLLEAVRRGAERVLIVNTSGIEPTRMGPQKNAFKILTRTIDLLSGQPRPGELQQGELAALERRWIEYNVCLDRLGLVSGVDKGSLATFCDRRSLWPATGTRVEGAAPSFMGPGYFREVSSTWRTSWVFRPEEDLPSAEGYAFDPKVMRPLFELGVKTFQRRCRELLTLLAIDGPVASAACLVSEEDAVAQARNAYKPEAGCLADVAKMRSCP